jgi:AraC-like DNA-binding protein
MHYLNYKEIKPRGTIHFPIEYYHINSQHPQYAMPYHWHDELELIHVIEGSILVTLDQTQYQATQGDLLLVNGGVLHGGTPIDCIYECLVFNSNLLSSHPAASDFFRSLEKQTIRMDEYFPNQSDELHVLSQRLFYAMSKKEQGYQLTTLGTLYELFGILFSGSHYSKTENHELSNHKHIALLKQILQYIENSYADKITLEQLSKLAGMSPKYFCRFFYEMTHRTPIDYLNYYRIERACFKLVSTNLSITEVAFECGFNDLSYFIKTFKKYKAITPKQYLKAPLMPNTL